MRDKHLLSIRDFSKLTGIKQTTLRYYDDIGLFSPAYHASSGYRYYSPTQIITVNTILTLLELKIPTREIIKLQQNRTPEKMLDLCVQTKKELDNALRNVQRMNNIITTFQMLILEGIKVGDQDEFNIRLEYSLAVPGRLGPVNDYSDDGDFRTGFQNFCMAAMEMNLDLHYPTGGYFESASDFFSTPGQPKRFFLLDPSGRDEKAAGMYLSCYLKGDYGALGDLPERMKEYAEKNDITLDGPVYHIFLNDEISVKDPNEYVSLLTMSASPREK
ncbi:MAG: MerR family transcriptional regulator [Clostridiales Family XIII bacterium]|nr:MerR family transcriptional regulator [Clostridiales Family XIII bacterium]